MISCIVLIVERIVQALWVGGLWIVGYLVVPTLFATLDDRQLAGALAGKIFSTLSLFGLVCGVLLAAIGFFSIGKSWMKTRRAWAILLMLVITLVSLLVLQPMMQELKLIGLAVGSEAATQFSRLHGVSSVLYMVMSFLGLYVVVGPRNKCPAS